jgi:hypothetical protein
MKKQHQVLLMLGIEILPQKIVDTRTVILKAKFDSSKIAAQGETLKTDLFVRFGFVKPKPEDVLLIGFTKYYEPYIVIGGKYSIDYCKRHDYALKVGDGTQALFIDGKKFKAKSSNMRSDARMIELMGEEHLHYENETYVVLDRMLQEVPAENLFLAPFENELENHRSGLNLRRPQISLEEEITILRNRIAKRPVDVAEIIRENFEINERSIIYNPIYELTYKNLKNEKKRTALISGITGDVIIRKFEKVSVKLCLEPAPKIISTAHKQVRAEPEQARQFQVIDEVCVPSVPDMSSAGDFIVKERVDAVEHRSHLEKDCSQFSSKKTEDLAYDFMRRLGYKEGQFPDESSLDWELDVVEVKLPVMAQVGSKTKKQNKYEIHY